MGYNINIKQQSDNVNNASLSNGYDKYRVRETKEDCFMATSLLMRNRCYDYLVYEKA